MPRKRNPFRLPPSPTTRTKRRLRSWLPARQARRAGKRVVGRGVWGWLRQVGGW